MKSQIYKHKKRGYRFLMPVIIVIFAMTAWSRAYGESDRYLQVDGPCNLQFPRDHGAHPGYRTEWWYYTGNVETKEGRPFGFQLTFFRTQISPPGAEKKWPNNPSRWRTKQIYLAHAALSDLEAQVFRKEEKMARGAAGLAGVRQEREAVSVYLGDWSVRIGSGTHMLQVLSPEITLDLRAEPQKGPIRHGDDGYSRKGRKRESASCYYSFPRLRISGILKTQGEMYEVKGTGWMDHEFSSAPLEKNLSGWDWFSIQLSNHTELMLYLLRQGKGGNSEASSGTFIGTSGETRHLSREDFDVEVLKQWESPQTEAVYPSRWRIRVPSLALEVEVVPNMKDQELITEESTGVTYWEGSVSVRGTRDDEPITGIGYVELTGYDEPFHLGE